MPYLFNYKKLFVSIIIFISLCNSSYAIFNDKFPEPGSSPVLKQPVQTKPYPTSSEFFTSLSNIALLGKESSQISTEPNESINLFTGTVHRIYKEVSIPVAPGLNMEFIRSYSSSPYAEREYLSNNKYDNLDLAHPNWRFDSGYITSQVTCQNKEYDGCNPVYIAADGNSQKLIPDDLAQNIYKTKYYWQGHKHGVFNYTLIDNKGFKYRFDHLVHYRQWHSSHAIRTYLTKVETPDGAWVKYHYNGPYLVAVTSSEKSKTIEIKHTVVQGKQDKMHYYVQRPSKVYANKELVVSYGYDSFKKSAHNLNIFPVIAAQYNDELGNHYDY